MSPPEARDSKARVLRGAKEALKDEQSRGSVFKWIGGGIVVGGFWGPTAAIVVAFVAGTFLRRKYHEVIRLHRIVPVVEALDRRAASSDETT